MLCQKEPAAAIEESDRLMEYNPVESQLVLGELHIARTHGAPVNPERIGNQVQDLSGPATVISIIGSSLATVERWEGEVTG